MRFALVILAVALSTAFIAPIVQGDHQTARLTQEPVCKLQIRPAVTVEVSAARWPHVADHIADVRRHYSRHFHIDRGGADENRDESLQGYPTRTGYDRDEYPPAMAAEGGEGAQIRYVPSSENRSQGSVMGNELEPYCSGSHFRLVPVP